MSTGLAFRERLWTELPQKLKLAEQRCYSTDGELESSCERPHCPSDFSTASSPCLAEMECTDEEDPCTESAQPAELRNRFRTESNFCMPTSPWNPLDGNRVFGGISKDGEPSIGMTASQWTNVDGSRSLDGPCVYTASSFGMPVSQWSPFDYIGDVGGFSTEADSPALPPWGFEEALALGGAGLGARMPALPVAPPRHSQCILSTSTPQSGVFSYPGPLPCVEEQQHAGYAVCAQSAISKKAQQIQLSSLLGIAASATVMQPPAAPPAGIEPPAPVSSAEAGAEKAHTTIMLRNLPGGFSRTKLMGLLDSQGFAGRYDFAYLPCSFDTMASLSHAFVNMLEPADAQHLRERLDGFSAWAAPSDCVLRMVWNDKNQGLDELVERYRNSPVMHEDIPEECKPIILRGGKKAPFPPPTQKIKAPKICKHRA